MGRVGCEPLLFGDVCLQPREEAVDGVGEILELVAGAGVRQALVEVALGDLSGVAVIARSGCRTRPATSQPSAIETTVMTTSAIPALRSPW